MVISYMSSCKSGEDDGGKIIATLSSGEDITERKKVEEALQKAEERYRNLFEEAPLMYVITRHRNGEPHIVDCNDLWPPLIIQKKN